jgi:hypothetical protein
MNPASRSRTTEPAGLAELLAAHPNLAPALERAKGKIALKARVEADALGSNLKLILSDWCEERGISQISWVSANDPVKPEFAIDHLIDRLAQKLGEIRFAQFLERFADDLIELDENERRSQ